jgi:hypothetical protein
MAQPALMVGMDGDTGLDTPTLPIVYVDQTFALSCTLLNGMPCCSMSSKRQ